MPDLPIYTAADKLTAVLRAGNRVVVQAPTGSGKSTQVPQLLVDRGVAGAGRVVVLQPRRIAARMLARRVAWERRVPVGAEVGYQVRFECQSGRDTRIKYETDGIILRELLGDPELRDVGAIVFDEFHERHLYGDLMLALARRLQEASRPDLKLVVMSATLDVARVRDYLGGCPVVTAEGRVYPVAIAYQDGAARTEPPPVWDAAAAAVARLMREHADGDALVFMPGAYEIRRTLDALGREKALRGMDLLPLYGELGSDEQDRAMAPSARRKVVVATNVAETSLTIEGITLVVDGGLARKARFDPRRGINTLIVEPISRASAEQRAGRAGRLAPGVCLRLWSEREHARRDAFEAPEIHRVDLAETLLQLKQYGVEDVSAFPWIEAPLPGALEKSARLLTDLGALDAAGALTALGRRLAAFPLHPRLSRMLVAGERHGCVPTAVTVAALLQERGVLSRTRDAGVRDRRLDLVAGRDDSDVLILLRAWEAARAARFDRDACDRIGVHAQTARAVDRLRGQLLGMAREQGLSDRERDPSPEDLYRCLLTGFPDQVAFRVAAGAARCDVVHGRRGSVAEESLVAHGHRLLVACEIAELSRGRGEVDVQVSLVTAIEPAWLSEVDEAAVGERRVALYDGVNKRVRAEVRVFFRDLTIGGARVTDVTDDEAAAILAAEVVAGRLSLKLWDAKVEQWLARVNVVAAACPELGIAPMRDAGLTGAIEQICHGARGARDLKTQPVWPVLHAWLGREQVQSVAAYAPEQVTLGNGRRTRVHYDRPAQGPYVAVRIQDLYDTDEAPTICGGRVRLPVHILAPNQRPVQITEDLGSFWREGYAVVRRDLRGRYPKHEWR